MKNLYPDLTCAPHGVQRVAAEIRENHALVDQLIALINRTFVQCTRRKRLFQEETHLALPQERIITRWNTWRQAAFYYCENFEQIRIFVKSYLKGKSKTIENLHVLLDNGELPLHLAYITAQFEQVAIGITKLQERASLTVTTKILEDFSVMLESQYREKYQVVLS